ncbi:MAG: FAD-dependent oxidoreductase [Bacillota bacterium]|nr:FAD-dependent oxidoreductase [Bacillota bacterium]
MGSVWAAGSRFPERKALENDMSADVAIIGAGMAGLLTASLLREKGRDVVLIEAERTAGGVTQNTTAKITSQHDLFYDKLISNVGAEKAAMYAAANQEAIEEYAGIIEKNGIDCHFKRLPAYVYSLSNEKKLRDETEAAVKLGIDAEFVRETSLPIPVVGAVRFNNQAQFHPLEFLMPIAEKLTIYEHTKAVDIKDNTVFTEKNKIRADKIVVATHYPFINAPGYYFLRMHQERSYVIAFENAQELDGMYIDENENGYSFRNFGNLLLLGGGSHRTGKNTDGGLYGKIAAQAAVWYPKAVERYRWSAQDCFSVDEIPYIGRYSESLPDVYVATGFKKWGMTSSMVSAMILSDAITGVKNPYSEVFDPGRFNITASMKNAAADIGESVAGLSKSVFRIPDAKLESVQNGHGGIVEHDGRKIGVYKNQEGAVYAVSARCAHLGCELTWNPDELTWECPCHGSRYDIDGNVINNPAIKNLEKF